MRRIPAVTRSRGAALIALALVLAAPWIFAQSSVQVGFAVLTPTGGRAVGAALFSFTNASGVLISEAGVGAVTPSRTGRIYVDEAGTRTGVAVANNAAATAVITWVLRDADGAEVRRLPQTLPSGRHTAQFVAEMFSNLPGSFQGTLAFDSTAEIGAIALREKLNARGEPLYATIPVVTALDGAPTAYFPHVAVGGDYVTQVVLVNPTAAEMTGRFNVRNSDGSLMTITIGSSTNANWTYAIPANGVLSVQVTRSAGLAVGSATVTADAGQATPAGVAVFQFRAAGRTVTEAAVPALPSTSAARLYVDSSGTRTGIALVNSSSTSADVTFSMINPDGTIRGAVVRTFASGQHTALFADELFTGLPAGYAGVLEVTSTGQFSALALKLSNNTRGEPVLTTLPVADLERLPASSSFVLPHVAFGGGFSTQIILINTDRGTALTGSLTFFTSSGTPMVLPGAGSASGYPFRAAPGGGIQLFPGRASERPAVVEIVDPSTGALTTEVAVNQGGTTRISLAILDSSGNPRTDLPISFASLTPEVATVDSAGNVRGIRAGFSTLTVRAGTAVTSATITVVRVEEGARGLEAAGVARDLARRLYLTNPVSHTVMQAETLQQAPVLFAGVAQSPGLRNGARAQSLFRQPGFLAIDHLDGSLYLADSANHVIRRIGTTASGQVSTLAGTGQPGAGSGPASQAAFNQPAGVALDGRGNLWVADGGNHTIRRIRLRTGVVETVAGSPGSAGLADGRGAAARFNTPAGLTVDFETPAQQLERERLGLPPSPVKVIVADSGNGAIRRIFDDGTVETLDVVTRSISVDSKTGIRRIAAVSNPFNRPTGVAIDGADNIYVTEPTSGRVRVILRNGNVVPLAQSGSFTSPRDVLVADNNVIVGDSSRTTTGVTYGSPFITDISVSSVGVAGGDTVTLMGRDFAPESRIIIGGVVITSAVVTDTTRIGFVTPPLPSGVTTITVQHRGGLDQVPLNVQPVPFSSIAPGSITTIAGGTTFIADGTFATFGRLSGPEKIAIDSAGNIFIADRGNNRIRRIELRSGVINTVAGNGESGYSGDGGPAVAATLDAPFGIAVDAAGDLYIAEFNSHVVRRVNRNTGSITTAAGSYSGFSGDGGPASRAEMYLPTAAAIAQNGDLYIADQGNHRIRRVSQVTGIISTIAGSGPSKAGLPGTVGPPGAFSGDGGPATAARMNSPFGLCIDTITNRLIVADSDNDRVRAVNLSTGIITTVAGNGTAGFSGDGGPATAAMLRTPTDVACDPNGGFLISDFGNLRIRRVSSTGTITTTIGNGTLPGPAGSTPGNALQTGIEYPKGVALDSAGNTLFSDLSQRLYRVTPAGTLAVRAGVGGGQVGDGFGASFALLRQPQGIHVTPAGDLIVADADNHRIRRMGFNGQPTTTLAGTGIQGVSDDGTVATAAALQFPSSVTTDLLGNLVFTDTGSDKVRMIEKSTGNIKTLAGSGVTGFAGDGGPGTQARLATPKSVVPDYFGNLFFADRENHRIRRIDVNTGVITTVVGTGTPGFSGDGGPSARAQLTSPEGIAIDIAGNLYIADTGNSRLRWVTPAGVITTVAGGGGLPLTRNPVTATQADLSVPVGLAIDGSGNVYIAHFDHAVSRWNRSSGTIAVVAGSFVRGSSGDGGPAASARVQAPTSLVVDGAGNLLIADTGNGRVRAVKAPIP